MEVKNMVTPNQTQMNEFLEGDIDSPISMVNLLKFKEKAEYEDGRDTEMSGKEAYQIYATEVQEHLRKVGAEIVFGGAISRLMLACRRSSRSSLVLFSLSPCFSAGLDRCELL